MTATSLLCPGWFRGDPDFNPVDAIGWSGFWWTEGPEFKALGLANGGAVTTWPDEISTRDWTQATAADKPTYRSSVSKFGGRPAVDADGNDFMTGVIPAVTQPFSAVSFCSHDALTFGGEQLLSLDGTGDGQPVLGELFNLYTMAADAPGITVTTTAATAHLRVDFFNGVSSFLSVDGASTAGSAGAGNPAGTPTLFCLASAPDTQNWAGELVFLGLYAGNVTTHARWSEFLYWVARHYA